MHHLLRKAFPLVYRSVDYRQADSFLIILSGHSNSYLGNDSGKQNKEERRIKKNSDERL